MECAGVVAQGHVVLRYKQARKRCVEAVAGAGSSGGDAKFHRGDQHACWVVRCDRCEAREDREPLGAASLLWVSPSMSS